MFDTSNPVPRTEGKRALNRLARKLRSEIRFATKTWMPVLPSPKPGEIQEAYDPGSMYNISPEGRRIREAVLYKRPAKQLRIHGAMAGADIGKPQVTYKVMRPLAPGQSQPYSTPKGMHWATVGKLDIQRGEAFKEQPTYRRNRLDWSKYVGAHVENQLVAERKRLQMAGVAETIGETRKRLHGQLTRDFLAQVREQYAGERMSKSQLRAATSRHIEGMMRGARDYMAGGLRQSRAIIRARGVDPLLARAHPERMVEYKRRLEAATPARQLESKATRGFMVNQLNEIAARGMNVVAQEKESDWMLKRDKLHLHRQMIASPEWAQRSGLSPEKLQEKVAEADAALEEHFNLRRTQAEIKDQASRTVALLHDKPESWGGTPLSKENAETIADILQKGSKSGKPITAEHVKRIKSHFDDLYARTANVEGVQKGLLARGDIFKKPIATARAGYPHLGKLGVGAGIAGIAAGGLVLRSYFKQRKRERQMSSRGRVIQFAKKFGDLPEDMQKIINVAFDKIAMQGYYEAKRKAAATGAKSTNIVVNKRLRRRAALTKLKRKWGTEFLQKVLAHPELPTHPNAPNWKTMFEHKQAENLMLRRQQATHAHIRAETLKEQESILGAQAKERERESYTRGIQSGKEMAKASAQSAYEKRADELAAAIGEQSEKRARRLKWIAGGTLGAGAIGGYALGRHDKASHERHDALAIMALTKRRMAPRQPRQTTPPGFTITIGGINGNKRRNVEFAANDDDEGPEWLREWAHKKLYGRDYSTLGQAQRVKKYYGRTHRLIRDINIKRQGLPNLDPRGRVRKNEWEKPWVAGALTTAGLASLIFGGKRAVRFLREASPQSRIGQLVEGFRRGNVPGVKAKGLAKVGGFYHGIGEELKRWRDKPLHAKPKYEYSKFDPVTGKMKSEEQIKREIAKASNVEVLEEIAKRRKIHPWEKGAGETGFRSVLQEIRFRALPDLEPPPYLPSRTLVARDRYMKAIHERDIARANRLYAHAAAIGAGAGALLRGKLPVGKAAVIGAAAGLGTQKAARIIGKTTRDQFGERSVTGKRIERTPGIVGVGAIGTILARRLWKGKMLLSARGRPIQFASRPSREEKEDLPRDIAIGAIEAGAAFPFTERAVRYLRPKGGPGKILAAGIVGGLATGGIGYGINRTLKAIRERREERRAYRRAHPRFSWMFSATGTPRKRLGLTSGLVRFEEPKRKHNLLAGAAIASIGIPQARGAFKFTRAALNPRIGRFTGKGTHYGKMVADYLEGSQQVLNRGPIGKLAGVVLRNPQAAPVKKAVKWIGGGSSGVNKLNREHFSSFRASPTEALLSWTEEVEAAQRAGSLGARKHGLQSEAAFKHIRDLTANKGYNETEAIRHVAMNPKHQELFRRLATFKGEYFPRYAQISSGIAAAPLTAGAGVAATKRKNGNASPKRR